METPPQFYKIRDLVLLPNLSPREQLCEETIIRYMESFDALPPVSIQEGTGVLVDGFHRVEAATRLGAEAIRVHMLDIPDEELHLYAGLANCGHGRAMSRAERNRFVVRLVEEYGWPVEKVARTVGVGQSSVNLALREHRYNQALSERLGAEVQVINSSHVQALYRVGDEQRAQLLEAVASKTDEDGRPRPLTGAELKSLVDRMEDPKTSSEELRSLLEDPLARPELTRRRPAMSPDAEDTLPVGTREVERRTPLFDGTVPPPSAGDLRAELLSRALAPQGENSPFGACPDTAPNREDSDETWDSEPAPTPFMLPVRHGAEEEDALLSIRSQRPAPLDLDAPTASNGEPAPTRAGVSLLEPAVDERDPGIPLREAEQLLSGLCAKVEDADLWEQLRTARDLVREAAAILRG